MSHLKLVVTVSTDGDDYAGKIPSDVMQDVLFKIRHRLGNGRDAGTLVDGNGNSVGSWDFSQVVD